MAHFAQLDENNVVVQVLVVSNDVIRNEQFPASEPIGVEFCQSLYGAHTNWRQTSYSKSFRYNYASNGYLFDESLDAFIPPKPFQSWTLNADTARWEPPVAYPNDGKAYYWNEDTQTWVLIKEQVEAM